MFVEIQGVSFHYKNVQKAVITDFSLSVKKGEVVGVVGQSGSGKSTLLRIIAGLETPSSGVMKIAEKTIFDKNVFLQPEKREIGMVFQDYALFPHLTVARNIQFGLHRLSKEERLQRLEEMLELVELKEFADRYPHELSGGQQQRVALARALAPKPALLLMDEPFSNLDANLKEKIRKDLKRILQQEQMTCIFVTHDHEDVRAICSRTINLSKKDEVK